MIRAAVLGVVLTLALTAGAHRAVPRVKVSLKSTDQARILERGALSVKVGVPRRTPAAQDQKSDHTKIGGTITDHCAGAPCHGVPQRHSALKYPTKPAPPTARTARSLFARRMSRCSKPLAS